MFWLLYALPIVLFLSVLAVLPCFLWPSCSACFVLAALHYLPLSIVNCPALTYMPWSPCVGCRDSAMLGLNSCALALNWLFYTGCRAQAKCPVFPVLAVLPWLCPDPCAFLVLF
jgi:hypothetical protein